MGKGTKGGGETILGTLGWNAVIGVLNHPACANGLTLSTSRNDGNTTDSQDSGKNAKEMASPMNKIFGMILVVDYP
jgi:hypothetical protein